MMQNSKKWGALPRSAPQITGGILLSLALVSGSLLPAVADQVGTSTSTPTEGIEGLSTVPPDALSSTPVDGPTELAEQPVEGLSETPAQSTSSEVTSTSTSMEELRGIAGASMGQGLSRKMKADAQTLGTDGGSVAKPYAAQDWTPPGVLGVDVSGHQPNIDWAAQSRLGAKFAYVKATEGIGFKSQFFSSQYAGSYKAGLIRGAYHFALPTESSGAAQAEYFVKNGGGWSADGKTLPPLLDIEYNPYDRYGNSCFNMSAGQMVSWIKDFSDRMLLLTKRLPVIYTTADWWRTCTGNSAAFSNHPLHIAAYPYDLPSGFPLGPGSLPGNWHRYDMWQFSDGWKLTGDSNVWRGTYSELQAFARNREAPTTPPVGIAATPQTVGVGDFNSDNYADVLQLRADGTLWFYPGKNDGSLGAAVRIGTGFGVYTSLVALGDFNSDGFPDFAGTRTDGSWWFYPGTGVVNSASNGYRPAIRTTADMSGYISVTGIGDLTGDHRPDAAAVRADGTLWLIPGTGAVSATKPGFGTAVKIGNGGWGAFSSLVGAGDVDKNGTDDFLAVGVDGALWLYPGTGRVTATDSGYGSRIKLGNSGWDKFADVVSVGDLNGDGQPDLIGRYSDSSYLYYAGSSAGSDGYKPAQKIGNSGWEKFKQVISVGDFDGDGHPDLLGLREDGSLYFYAGDGTGGYHTGQVVGNGWNVYMGVYGVGDYNKDGRPDLLAVREDGTLWFYAGTGRVSKTEEGYAPGLKIGRSGWNAFVHVVGPGDISGDKLVDLMGIRADGSVWLYAGKGKVSATSEGYAPAVKAAAGTLGAAAKVTSVYDFNGDGTNDLVATQKDGSLWFHSGSGKMTAGGSFDGGHKIGKSGWNAYSSIVGVGDSNRDGNTDMVAVNKNGSLWCYPGTSMRPEGFVSGVKKGNIL